MSAHPHTEDQLFALRVNAEIEDLAEYPRFSSLSNELTTAIVEGCAQFAASEFAPLNSLGDREGARLVDGDVHLPAGFSDAYLAYVEQGWNTVSGSERYGGQGLPYSMAVAVLETLGTANMALTLLPMLTMGAIEAIEAHGSSAQKETYLAKLISGEWSGTMNLTEPQAGSDVGALRATATPITSGPDEGKFLIKGTKIFISWGGHDLSRNIIHLVLARTPNSPPGSQGISLFVVPRFHVEPDGSTRSPQNDLKVVSVERKLGIHASPTCMISYGDNDRCIGELIGREHEGLKCMFTMMNSARINIGAQGVQVAEAALQKASRFAVERVQSPRAGSPDKRPVAIAEHPDVRRMLLRMRALTEGARALLYYTCGRVDRAALGDSAAGSRSDLLVPMLKLWGTNIGCEVTSLAIQIHGGVGYIEDTGVAQLFRDARIAPIYEGTNGIQAIDLVTRKLSIDAGATFGELMNEIVEEASGFPDLVALARTCSEIGSWMLAEATLDDRLAGADAFCTMCAVACAGWQLVRQAKAAATVSSPFSRRKTVVVRFFLEYIVAEALSLRKSALAGAELLFALDAGELAG